MRHSIKSSFMSIREKESPIFLGVFTLLVFIRVWLMTGIPKMFLKFGHDDLFFVKAAHYLIHKEWMGPYSQMTLVKVPFYAFFLVTSFFTGLPLLVTETIFYILACIVLFFALSPLIKSRWWRLILFIILLFIPASLATHWTLRVYRQFTYFSLTLFVVAFAIGLYLRTDQKLLSLIGWATGLGISMGAFLLCREEGIWIYPILFILLAVSVGKVWRTKMNHKWFRSIAILSSIIIWYIPVFVVSYLNYSHYGFWGTSEQLDKDFNRIISTLGRIKTDTWYPYSPVTRAGLAKAYEVSPLLAELKLSIEAEWDGWQLASDATMESKANWYREKYYVKGAELGAHFPFMFKDVLAVNGYYSNGKYPAKRFNEMANQLESACDDGRLECYPKINIPFVTSIRPEHLPLFLRYFSEDLRQQLLFAAGTDTIASLDLKSWPPYQEPAEIGYFDEFAYNQLHPQGFEGLQSYNELVGGKTDVRLRILHYKERIMRGILSVYMVCTVPILIAIGLGWMILLIINLVKREKSYSLEAFHVFLFVLGLLISREITLAIVSATTTTSMLGYAASNYLFIYIALFLAAFFLVDHMTQRISTYHRSTSEGNSQMYRA